MYARIADIYTFSFYFFFIFFLSKERFRKQCPFLLNFGKEIAITSERMCFTSEEIRITSEFMPIN